MENTMMQHTIMAVFDTARHAQIAVDDLLVCDIPSETIHQYPLHAGDAPAEAMRTGNELHRPPGVWTWLINDHPSPASDKAHQVALYHESRARNEPVLVAVASSTLNEAKIRKILNDHAPLDVKGSEEGQHHETTSLAQESQMDPSFLEPTAPVEMTEYH